MESSHWREHCGGRIKKFYSTRKIPYYAWNFFLHFLINKYIINIKLVYYIKIFILIFFNGIGTG